MSSTKPCRHHLSRKVFLIGVSALLSMLLAIEARSQSAPDIPLQGSHANYVDDGVDLFSGKLEQIIKLTGVGGRGGINQGLYLPLRNTEWTVMDTGSFVSGDRQYTFYRADQTNYVVNYPRTGYSTPGQLKIETRYTGWFLWELPTVTEITFTANNGSIIKFRDVLTNGQPYEARSRGCVLSGFQPPNPPPTCARGRVFRATDGSNAIFVADNEVYDMVFYDAWGNPTPYSGHNNMPGTIFLSDGTRIRFDSSFNNMTRITDRNGNYMTFEYVTETGYEYNFLKKITDSLNRQITINYGGFNEPSYFDEIIYKGFGETERRIRINYTKVENVMAPGQYLGAPLFPGVHTRCYLLSSGEPCDPTPAGGMGAHQATSIIVASSIVLPNGQQYQFYYNNYLELARIKDPTGSYTDYSYSGMIGAGNDGFSEPLYGGGGSIYRRISAVKLYDEADHLVNEKTFSNIPQYLPDNTLVDNVTVDVKDTSGAVLSRSKHYFYNVAGFQSFYTFLPANYGKEHKLEVLDPVTQNVLRKTEITWEQRAEFPWCGGGGWTVYQCPITPAGMSGPPVDPRITEVKITLEDGQVAKKAFAYDQYNNVTDSYQFDYGAGQPGPLLRRGHTDYVTDPNYTSTTTRYLLRLPLQSWISSDANGNNKLSFTQREYDNYASDTNHAPLLQRGNVSGLDTSYLGVTARGNLTAETQFINAQNQTGPITSYLQYDVLGNSVKRINARGLITTIDYDDRFGSPNGEARGNWDTVAMPPQLNGKNTFAFATSITNQLGHTTFTQFDYSTGSVVDAEDANQVVDTYIYDDPLGRQTRIITANNIPDLRARKSTVFDDVNRVTTVTSDFSAYGDDLIKSETRYNSLGETTEVRNFEPGGYIAARSEYDPLGRKLRTSNPFRPWSSEVPIWTTYAYDTLGRVISTTSPDNAVVATAYSGNQVTVTDQAGKQRRSVSDALGRMIQVYEDPNNLNYLTSYTYDAKDDLITIHQGNQTRTQVYDSLKRLTSTVNPESGAVAYQYDQNGNLLVKTDPRGVSTHFSYDDLDRVSRRWYNGSSDANATQNNSPALPSSVSATDEIVFFYDSQTLPKGAPTFAAGATTGRLVAMTYGGGSSGDYFGYDAVGRSSLKIQQTGGIDYQMNATYNRAGAVETQTYPSGRTVAYDYDTAGRTSGVTGTLGDGTQRTYSSEISYSSLGGLSQEQLGTTTPIWNKLFYNSRGHLSEIRAGLTANDTSWERGAIINHYSDGCWGMCGGQNSTTSMADNDGNVKKQEHWIQDEKGNVAAIFTQKYQFDGLNRLQRVYDGDPNSPVWQQRYSYDRYGNRTIDVNATFNTGVPTLSFGVDVSTNRLTPPAGFAMNYDNAGNLIFDNYTGQGARNYDAQNRMTASAGTPVSSYVYDAAGHRVKRIVGAAETWQVYGIGGELIAEYTANASPSSPEKEYGHRNGQLLITAAQSGGGLGDTVEAGVGSERSRVDLRWLIVDQLGTPRMILDQKGSLENVSRHDYLPFGEELFAGTGGRTELLGYSANDGTRQKFTGYEHDDEAGLEFAQARYYASTQGRFTSPDPIGGGVTNPQSLNHYAYAFNNPIAFIDPQGLTGFEAGGLLSSMMSFYGDLIEYLPGFGTRWGSFLDLYESQFAQGVQITIKAARDRDDAMQALADQDMIMFWNIVNSNPNLQAVDAQGNVVTQDPAEAQQQAQDVARWKQELKEGIAFAKLIRSSYRRFGPIAKDVDELEAMVTADVERRCRCRTVVAGTTDSSGNVTIQEDPNPYRKEATRRHEEDHRQTTLQGRATYGDGPAYYSWWLNPRNWAADEVKAYSTEIKYMQQVVRRLR